MISWRLTSLMPVNIFQISLAMWLILTSGDDDNDVSPDKCFVSDKKSSTEVESSPPLSPSSPFIRSYTGPNKTSSPITSTLDNKEAASKLIRSSLSLYTIFWPHTWQGEECSLLTRPWMINSKVMISAAKTAVTILAPMSTGLSHPLSLWNPVIRLVSPSQEPILMVCTPSADLALMMWSLWP